jgi:hypothetical protein
MGLCHAIVSVTKPRFGIKAKLLVRTMKWPDTRHDSRNKFVVVKEG